MSDTGESSRRRLSIVQVVDNLNAGGLERMVIDLAVAHRAAGHGSAIFCLGERGALAGQAESFGIPVTAFQKTSGVDPRISWRMARALRRLGANVVHAHNPGVHHYSVLAAKLARAPVVVNTRHGVSSSSGRRYDERWFQRTLRWTDKVIYVSSDSQRYYTAETGLVPAAKGVTIFNGVPLEKFLAAPRPRPRRDGEPLRLATLGRLVPVKAHATLLEAFAILRKRLMPSLPVELYIYGEGELRQALEKDVARLGLEGQAFLPGQTHDVPGALAAADAFGFSSTSEGQPMVILEAMASGLPIVSTRVGGVPEVAPEGETAWYCEPGDAAKLAALFAEALSAGGAELAARGERARRMAIERYSIEAAQRRYETVFGECLAAKKR